MIIAASSALLLSPLRPAAPLRAAPRMGEGDELGGAISSTFGEIFGSFFKPNAEREAEIDRAYAEQLEVAEQRRRGGIDGVASRMRATEERRAKESAAFTEKFAWQQGADPLPAFLKRRDEGKKPATCTACGNKFRSASGKTSGFTCVRGTKSGCGKSAWTKFD